MESQTDKIGKFFFCIHRNENRESYNFKLCTMHALLQNSSCYCVECYKNEDMNM